MVSHVDAAPESCFAPSAGAKGAASFSKNPESSSLLARRWGCRGHLLRNAPIPEKHACGFDFKGASRDAIARANPLIKGEKLTNKI
uniref:Uncharacterized protein n=1 Tax=Oryza glumipatula TaxID=40148 RepID=A0A0D9YFE3_9ORYZ